MLPLEPGRQSDTSDATAAHHLGSVFEGPLRSVALRTTGLAAAPCLGVVCSLPGGGVTPDAAARRTDVFEHGGVRGRACMELLQCQLAKEGEGCFERENVICTAAQWRTCGQIGAAAPLHKQRVAPPQALVSIEREPSRRTACRTAAALSAGDLQDTLHVALALFAVQERPDPYKGVCGVHSTLNAQIRQTVKAKTRALGS